MGILLDYIRNKNDTFKRSRISKAGHEEILWEIKKAFKYTQNVLREDFLISKSKRKEAENKNLEPKTIYGSDLGLNSNVDNKIQNNNFQIESKDINSALV